MINFINPSDMPVGVPGTEILAGPGRTIGVPDGYALPRRIPGTNTRRPSVIEMVCPQLVPADDEGRDRIATEFAEDAVKAKPNLAPHVEAALRSMGISPEVAKLFAAKDLQDMASRAGELAARLDRQRAAVAKEAEEVRRTGVVVPSGDSGAPGYEAAADVLRSLGGPAKGKRKE